MTEFKGTTICAVKRDGKTAIAGDGQVTMSQSIIFKNNAVKVRRIYNGKVIFGFAGSVADAFTLSERFEEMLSKYSVPHRRFSPDGTGCRRSSHI